MTSINNSNNKPKIERLILESMLIATTAKTKSKRINLDIDLSNIKNLECSNSRHKHILYNLFIYFLFKLKQNLLI